MAAIHCVAIAIHNPGFLNSSTAAIQKYGGIIAVVHLGLRYQNVVAVPAVEKAFRTVHGFASKDL
jgi:hypothetical protein